MIFNDLIQAIGHTPLVKLQRLNPNPNINFYVKLEGQNPGGSLKDRVAAYMIEQAEKRGELGPGKIILEATSGNMGIGLAMVGAHKGYDVHILMSEGMSEERRTMLKAFGAKLILSDKNLGTQGAVNIAKEMVASEPEKYWFSNQFNNPDNPLAHYHGLGKELLKELPQIDCLLMGSGTSGTMVGLTKRFRQDSPNTKLIAVFPPAGYKVQGMQNPEGDFVGAVYQPKITDERFDSTKEDANQTTCRAAREEGLFLGMSSGAVLHAAIETAKKMTSGNLVAVLPDRGEKYLSTELFE